MLVRKDGGNVFHIVCTETSTHYLCLCGARIRRNSQSGQRCADYTYERCPKCRKLERERLSRCPGLKVY